VEGREGEEAAGCVGLISSGNSSEESAFLDASETGGDVFFLTAAKLAPQDQEASYNIYDAHECTSASPCTTPPVPPPPCDTEASCRPSPTPQPPIYGAGPSETFSGPGNLAPGPSSSPKVKSAAQLKAERLAKALKACRKDRSKEKRLVCEKQARERYGAKAGATKRGGAGKALSERGRV